MIYRRRTERTLTFPPSSSYPLCTSSLLGQMEDGLGSPLDPREARQGLREQPIISNSNTWQETDLMGLMSLFFRHRACNEPSHHQPSHFCCRATVQILDSLPELAKRMARKIGQEWGLIFACPSIVSGGKK